MIVNPAMEVSNTTNVSFNECNNLILKIVANRALTVLSLNRKRAYAAFINVSLSDITLILGETTDRVPNKGIILKPNGSFEITQINLFTGKVSAICTADSELSAIECFFT